MGHTKQGFRTLPELGRHGVITRTKKYNTAPDAADRQRLFSPGPWRSVLGGPGTFVLSQGHLTETIERGSRRSRGSHLEEVAARRDNAAATVRSLMCA